MLDFYLSEMSVSDLHGGGITLQRILGEELGNIKRFIHPSRFARDLLPNERILPRSEFLLSRFELNTTRRLINKPSAFCYESSIVKLWHAYRCAAKIDRLFEASKCLTALVCPQSEVSVWIIEFLKRRRAVKYITWVMDDHVVRYRSGRWEYPDKFRKTFQRHLKEASSTFVISPVLRDFYEHEFGVTSEVLFSPAEHVGEPSYMAPSQDKRLMIGYFGSVGAWQREALAQFAAALRAGRDCLHIYSGESRLPQALHLPTVEFKGALAKESVRKTMRQYDAVLIPACAGDAERHLTEFNIATKMSECIASGTVTIVLGPAYAAMVRFLETTGAACIITERNLADWPRIADLLRDADYRRRLLDAARELVLTELSSKSMRERWRTAIIKLAAQAELHSPAK